MSVEFTLSGCSLDAEGWDQLLREWAREEELFAEACFVEGTAHLLGTGSIRGAILSEGEAAIDVRLNAFSSRSDWRRAYAVVREALTRGGGTLTRQDGEVLAADALTAEAAEAAAVADFVAAAGALAAGDEPGEGGPALLPVGDFLLPIAPGDLPDPCGPEAVPEVEAELAARVERYALAFVAASVVLSVGGKRVRLATWSGLPTLIGQVDVVAIEGIEDPVPVERVLELLGERAEALGSGEQQKIYLPQLEDAADAALLEALREASAKVEAFVAEQGERLEDDAGQGEGGAAMLVEMQRAAQAVAQALTRGGDVQELRRQLVREGLREDMIDAVFGAAGVVLQTIQAEGGLNARAAQRLANSGLPSTLIEAVLTELGQATADQAPEEPASTLTGLVLLALGALIALVIYFATRS